MQKPADYNARRMELGLLEHRHLVPAVELLQAELGLAVDGAFGPVTLEAWTERYEFRTQVGDPSPLAEATVQVAALELGRGEEHQNNAGEALHRYRDFPFGDDYQRPIGEWCAYFVGYCWEQGARRVNTDLPFDRRFYDRTRNRQMPVGSAKRLGRRIAAAGSEIPLEEVRRGDVLVWDRGRRNSPAGHIAIVELVDRVTRLVYTIEGNVGAFPAAVARRQHDMDRPGRLELVARV